MLFVSLFFSSVSDAKLSLTRSAPMWDKWEKRVKKKCAILLGFNSMAHGYGLYMLC